MKEAPLSGVIYAVLVIVWACVLVPMWVRRNDDEAEDIVSSPSRILPRRRLPAEQRPATRPATAAGTGRSDSASDKSPVAAPRRPMTPAERRQRLLIAVSVLAGLPALLFIAGLVPAAVALVGALPLAGYGALRYAAQRPTTEPDGPPQAARTPSGPGSAARTRSVPSPAARSHASPDQPAPSAGSARVAVAHAKGPAPRRAPAVPAEPAPAATAAEEVFDRQQYDEPTPAPAPRSPTWSPVPVPLPTYLTSRRGPAAPRRRQHMARPAPAPDVRQSAPAPRRAVND